VFAPLAFHQLRGHSPLEIFAVRRARDRELEMPRASAVARR
jgi:hypothetical protein